MKQVIKKLSGAVAVLALAAATLFVPVVSVSAACDPNVQTPQNGAACAQAEGAPSELFGGTNSIFTIIVNTLLFIIGAVSVIMLIWGGIRYTTSAGNSTSVTAAKNTIMYAVIGLIIAFLAYAIVNWLVGSFSTTA